MSELNKFKTTAGNDRYLRFIPEYDSISDATELLNIYNSIKDEYDEDDLLNFITEKVTFNFGPKNWELHHMILGDATKKLYINIIDNYIQHETLPIEIILQNICMYTDDIELFLKYYVYNKNTLKYFCNSLLYSKNLSNLSNYIFNNYTVSAEEKFNIYFFDKSCDSHLIQIVVDMYNIDLNRIDILNIKRCYLTTESYIEIVETIVRNTSDSVWPELSIFQIFGTNDIAIVEYFMKKYFNDVNVNILFKSIECVIGLPMLKYLVELIGIEKFEKDFFNYDFYYDSGKYSFVHDCEALKWLFDNGFEVDVDMDNLVYIEPIILKMQNMIATNNHDQIKQYTKILFNKLFYYNCTFEPKSKIFDSVPIYFFDLDVIFEISIINNCTDIVDLVLAENFKPKNIQDVIHDLKIFNNTQMLEYIDMHPELF